MAYSAEISRTNPSCFLFLIDQSSSMEEPFAAEPGGVMKCQKVAAAINRLLQTLVLRCAKSEGIRDYFHVGVIGYGSHVGPALGGPLAGRNLVPISDIANHPLRVEERIKKVDDGAGGLVDQVIKFPVWFDPRADGATPMCEALELAAQIVGGFICQVPGCFPPIVVNITDGEATDGDPEPFAEDVRRLSSDDGEVLLYNLHLSSFGENQVFFPDSVDHLPDPYAQQLFRMSSVLPWPTREIARAQGFSVNNKSRGFMFQADGVAMIQFLDIGTRVDKQLR